MSRYNRIFSSDPQPISAHQLHYIHKHQTSPVIHLRDLVVLSVDPDDSHGESNKKSNTSDHQLISPPTKSKNLLACPSYDESKTTEKSFCSEADFTRLIQYAVELLETANSQHEPEPYFVTRIGTAEFTFYTQAPLNEEQFTRLLDFMKFSAQKQQQNVHALLSSFAVWINDQLCNIALYVTCGESAEVHTIIKAEPSTIDLDYQDADSLFRQSPKDSTVPEITVSGVVLADGRALINNQILTIQVNDSTMQIFTIVCFDHAMGYGQRLLLQQLNEDSCKLTTPFYNYVLTSNIINPTSGDTPTTSISQYDPRYSRSRPDFDSDVFVASDNSPIFGPPTRVYDMGTRPLHTLKSEHEIARRRQNIRIYQQQLGCTISTRDINLAIKKAAEAYNADEVISLLPLSLHPPISALRIVAYTHIDALPAKELNQLIDICSELSCAQMCSVALRLDELENEPLNRFARHALNSRTLRSTELNLLAQQAQRLSNSTVDKILTTDDLYEQLSIASLNALACDLENIHEKEIINKLACHFRDVKSFAQQSIIKKAEQLEASTLHDICMQMLDRARPNLLLATLCQQIQHLPSDIVTLLTEQATTLSKTEINTIADHISYLNLDQFNHLLNGIQQFTSQSFALMLERIVDIHPHHASAVLTKAATLSQLSAEQFNATLNLLPHANSDALLAVSVGCHTLTDFQFEQLAITLSAANENAIESFIAMNANRSLKQLVILYNHINNGTSTDNTLAQLIISRSINIIKVISVNSRLVETPLELTANNMLELLLAVYQTHIEHDSLMHASLPGSLNADIQDLLMAFETISPTAQRALYKQLQTYCATTTPGEDTQLTVSFGSRFT
ncbi:MAG: hypothetical protein P1U63_10955 [Coxiellaceae bacterium]|nr:hypothetical protein [Coxiellaceae bacterium]